MLIAAIVLFVLAAIFGLITVIAIFKNRPTSKPVVFIHGGLAAIGLLLVILFTAEGTLSAPIASLILFIVAALAGFVMFAADIQKKPVPKVLAGLHPVVAAIGLILLIVFVVSR